jgi:hypothetical protein
MEPEASRQFVSKAARCKARAAFVFALAQDIDNRAPALPTCRAPRRGSQGSGSARLGLSQKGGLPCHAAGRTFRTVQGHRLPVRSSSLERAVGKRKRPRGGGLSLALDGPREVHAQGRRIRGANAQGEHFVSTDPRAIVPALCFNRVSLRRGNGFVGRRDAGVWCRRNTRTEAAHLRCSVTEHAPFFPSACHLGSRRSVRSRKLSPPLRTAR